MTLKSFTPLPWRRRFHPGRQFLQWHAARCQELLCSSSPSSSRRGAADALLLVQLRGAYSSLRFVPGTRRLARRMEEALEQAGEEGRMQARRAGEAAASVWRARGAERARRGVPPRDEP